MYTYIYTSISLYIHIYTHTRMHALYTYIHTFISLYIHIACVYMYTYIYTFISLYIHMYLYIDRKNPPPPGGFSIYYVPWSRAVCKGFHDEMRRSHLVVKSLTHGSWSGNIVNRIPPRGGGVLSIKMYTYIYTSISLYIHIAKPEPPHCLTCLPRNTMGWLPLVGSLKV